jgi:RND family efflux transporter MFP subunit
MTENKPNSRHHGKKMGPVKTLIISAAIIVAGVVVTALIFMTEPKAKRGGAVKETAMLVEVITPAHGDFNPDIAAIGVVLASRDIMLKPQVAGEVIALSEDFTPGGFAQRGAVLFRIDPSDYRNTLRQKRSELLQATADLNIEQGRQNVAKKDYQLFDGELSKENEALILRKPQLDTAKSKVEAARAAVSQAELELSRTVVKAPFDAHVIDRHINVGSQVSRGENAGRLVGIDTYWVETTLPLSKTRWLRFPEGKGVKGSEVRIRNRSAWEEDEHRIGHLFRFIGSLEQETRLARVLVSVEDPMAKLDASSGLPPLVIGSFVEVSIRGDAIPDVIRLKRDYLRKGNTVWVMKDGKLNIRDVDILLQDKVYAYISGGLDKDDKIVTTNLSRVVEGEPLRIEAGAEHSDAEQAASGDNQ